MNKITCILTIALLLLISKAEAQCLSAMNPVGGAENLLALEKNALRAIVFYKGGASHDYYNGSAKSDFNLIDKAAYNYLSTTLGYGLSPKFTLEFETGFFINKTQFYNTVPEIKLSGSGFSNLNFLLKYNFYSDLVNRIYFSSAAGIKIPASQKYKSVNHVELPYQLQPSQGAFGFILNSSFVKENSAHGMRYFVTNRVEINGVNQKSYIPGTSIFTGFYVSKHLMFQWLKGDWTAIFQLRNEIRLKDKYRGKLNQSTGSCLFFVAPQINYVVNEKWNISTIVDLPVYQYFNGTQLGGGIGFSAVLSRTFSL